MVFEFKVGDERSLLDCQRRLVHFSSKKAWPDEYHEGLCQYSEGKIKWHDIPKFDRGLKTETHFKKEYKFHGSRPERWRQITTDKGLIVPPRNKIPELVTQALRELQPCTLRALKEHLNQTYRVTQTEIECCLEHYSDKHLMEAKKKKPGLFKRKSQSNSVSHEENQAQLAVVDVPHGQVSYEGHAAAQPAVTFPISLFSWIQKNTVPKEIVSVHVEAAANKAKSEQLEAQIDEQKKAAQKADQIRQEQIDQQEKAAKKADQIRQEQIDQQKKAAKKLDSYRTKNEEKLHAAYNEKTEADKQAAKSEKEKAVLAVENKHLLETNKSQLEQNHKLLGVAGTVQELPDALDELASAQKNQSFRPDGTDDEEEPAKMRRMRSFRRSVQKKVGNLFSPKGKTPIGSKSFRRHGSSSKDHSNMPEPEDVLSPLGRTAVDSPMVNVKNFAAGDSTGSFPSSRSGTKLFAGDFSATKQNVAAPKKAPDSSVGPDINTILLLYGRLEHVYKSFPARALTSAEVDLIIDAHGNLGSLFTDFMNFAGSKLNSVPLNDEDDNEESVFKRRAFDNAESTHGLNSGVPPGVVEERDEELDGKTRVEPVSFFSDEVKDSKKDLSSVTSEVMAPDAEDVLTQDCTNSLQVPTQMPSKAESLVSPSIKSTRDNRSRLETEMPDLSIPYLGSSNGNHAVKSNKYVTDLNVNAGDELLEDLENEFVAIEVASMGRNDDTDDMAENGGAVEADMHYLEEFQDGRDLYIYGVYVPHAATTNAPCKKCANKIRKLKGVVAPDGRLYQCHGGPDHALTRARNMIEHPPPPGAIQHN